MLRAEIHFDWIGWIEWKREISDRAGPLTNGTEFSFSLLDERSAATQDERFLAIRADRLAGDEVPAAASRLAPATFRKRRLLSPVNLAQAGHEDSHSLGDRRSPWWVLDGQGSQSGSPLCF